MWRLMALIVAGSVSAAVEALSPSLETAVRTSVKADSTPSFSYALVDLNGDGQLDAVVLLRGGMWCGSGGCTMLIFRGTPNGFQLVSKSTNPSMQRKATPAQIKSGQPLNLSE
jgi:hypothetical protein